MGQPRKFVRKKALENLVRDIQMGLTDEEILKKYIRDGVSQEQLQAFIELARTVIKKRGEELEI